MEKWRRKRALNGTSLLVTVSEVNQVNAFNGHDFDVMCGCNYFTRHSKCVRHHAVILHVSDRVKICALRIPGTTFASFELISVNVVL